MIRTFLLGRSPPILKGMVKHYQYRQWPAPASAKVQIFICRRKHGGRSEVERRFIEIGLWRYLFEVEKDFTYFVLLRNKNVLFSCLFP